MSMILLEKLQKKPVPKDIEKPVAIKLGSEQVEVKIGLRSNKSIEVISGLSKGDIIVAEGLKKVRPRVKIKPIIE